MNHWYIDLKVESERHKDEAERAAAYRLVREAEASRRPSSTRPYSSMRIAFYWPWLARLGARLGALLVSWGCRLQTRFSDAALSDAALTGLASFSSPSGTEPCSS